MSRASRTIYYSSQPRVRVRPGTRPADTRTSLSSATTAAGHGTAILGSGLVAFFVPSSAFSRLRQIVIGGRRAQCLNAANVFRRATGRDEFPPCKAVFAEQ